MSKEKFERTKPHVNVGTIGHVVGNGHVRLVSHGGDHGNFRFINGKYSHDKL